MPFLFSSYQHHAGHPARGRLPETQEIKKLELKIRKLNRSGNKAGAVATIEQEYDADQIDRQIVGADAIIAELTARKAYFFYISIYG